MKRGKKLVIMLLALAVAVGGYWGVSKLNEKNGATETGGLVRLVDGDVTSLEWTSEGETLKLENESGKWVLLGQPLFPVDQETAVNMAAAVSGYAADTTIGGGVELSDYGLDSPKSRVTVGTQSGLTVFNQGDTNPLTGQCYISIDGDGNVYSAVESLDSLFGVSLSDLAGIEAMPTVADADEVTITGLVAQKRDESGVWHSASTGESTDDTKISALFDAIRAVSWQKLVDWTGETKFDNPVTVSCKWADGDFAVEIGQKTDDGYLARIPGSNLVYAIDAANAEVILATTDESLRSKKLFQVDWNVEHTLEATVSNVNYAPGDETMELIKTMETADLAEPKGEIAFKVTIDGEECVFREYDMNNYTATVGSITRLVSADEAEKLLRLVRYSEKIE